MENSTQELLRAISHQFDLRLPLEQVREITGKAGIELHALGSEETDFEYAQTERGRILRLRPHSELWFRLLPLEARQIQRCYGNDSAKLGKCLEAFASRKDVVRESEVFRAHEESEGAQPAMRNRTKRTTDERAKKIATQVLNYLEDIEANRINYGIYETFVTIDEILARSRENTGTGLGQPDVVFALEHLEKDYHVVRLGDFYRSRISEIVRLLINVKQRFGRNDIDTAPHLIRSAQVHFRNREQLRRELEFVAEIDRVQTMFTNHPYLREAAQALKRGFARLVNLPSEEVRLTRVQQQSFQTISDLYLRRLGGGIAITGNTGSGKTEASLLPLLLGAVRERLEGIHGCKIVLVYPRQALAKNQLERIIKLTSFVNDDVRDLHGDGSHQLSVGIAFGETPANHRELKQGNQNATFARGKWKPEDDGHVLPYFQDGEGNPVLLRRGNGPDWSLTPTSGSWKFDRFRATRRDLLEAPPDVLVITTETLHRWLGDPEYRTLFGIPDRDSERRFCVPRAVVVDEIHLYDTIHGAQIGLLLRRLRHRLRSGMRQPEEKWRDPLMIGMSATIGDPTSFWERLSGVKPVTAIEPNEEDLESSLGREYFLFLQPETYSRGKHVGDASAAIQTIMTVAHNMVRRGPDCGHDGKFRSLVFQDSIGKIKKLALEFYDAESNKKLARYRFAQPEEDDLRKAPGFHEGEYWYFDDRDPRQFSALRPAGERPEPLTSAPTPVYSGSSSAVTDLLQQDIIFATTSLEVGYDDPSIQFVMQHRAPRNAASFIQKKGRGGRDLDDRSITVVTLSQRSFRDAFFYQNPRLLYDPADYAPPLNVDNHFVQYFQAVGLIFDTLALFDRAGGTDASVAAHLERIKSILTQTKIDRHLRDAFQDVTSASFRRQYPSWQTLWQSFANEIKHALENDAEGFARYRPGSTSTKDLFYRAPTLPDNLFSTINLPVVNVMTPRNKFNGDIEWNPPKKEDIALAFSEFAPGRVTRRYGNAYNGKHVLHWRPPRNGENAVEIERYKADRDGPFDTDRLEDVAQLWGDSWKAFLPRRVSDVYGASLPSHFYRARFLELWTYGTLSKQDPTASGAETNWIGKLKPDGGVYVTYDEHGHRASGDNSFRKIHPDSNSFSLTFTVARPMPEAEPAVCIDLPPLFPGLTGKLEFFYGDRNGSISGLQVWEVQYGAEANIRLVKKRGPREDSAAGMGHDLVRYVGGKDRAPTFYGYDMETEGFRLRIDPDTLRRVAEAVFSRLWDNKLERTHLQDQYLRYLLKTRTWPLTGIALPINHFDQRTMADLIATARAETRACGIPESREFVERLTGPTGFQDVLVDATEPYWNTERVFTEDFSSRARATLASPLVKRFLVDEIFAKLGRKSDVRQFMEDTLLHSLKHAGRHLFLSEGSTRDEEVGSHAILHLTHEQAHHAFFVFERNRGGSGAARLAAQSLAEGTPDYRTKRFWNVSLACPVGDEEVFLRTLMAHARDDLFELKQEFERLPPEDHPRLRDDLSSILREHLQTQRLSDGERPYVQQLLGMMTGSVGFGDQTVNRFHLVAELLDLEAELAGRFNRPPTAPELAHFAVERIKDYPALERLQQIYQEHAEHLEAETELEGDPEVLSWTDRFTAQIEHLALMGCRDACPACLAAACDLGHIDVMRHTLSRRYLKMAHEHLTDSLTFSESEATLETLQNAAEAHGGYVIVTRRGDTDPAFMQRLKNVGFRSISVLFDYEALETRTFLRLEGTS